MSNRIILLGKVGSAVTLCTLVMFFTWVGRKSIYGNKSSVSQPSPGDFVCGPRSVQFILHQYGKKEDLIDLVREIQWPDIEHGSDLAALEQALQRRGVYTHAIKIGNGVRIRWPYPAILRLHTKRANGKNIGHFVIRMPSEDPNVETVWSGLDGYEYGPSDRLVSRCTGEVLLTSPVPIDRQAEAVVCGGFNFLYGKPLLYCVGALAAFLLSLLTWFKKINHPVLS